MTLETAKRIEKAGKELLSMEVLRGDNIEIKIRTAPEIENFFRIMSSGDKSTTHWAFSDGTKPSYYEWKGDSIDALADEFMSAYFNSYGGKLFDGERANVSILRTVGISNGVSIIFRGMMTKESLEDFSIQIRDFVIKLYKQFIRKVTIRVSMNVEEVM